MNESVLLLKIITIFTLKLRSKDVYSQETSTVGTKRIMIMLMEDYQLRCITVEKNRGATFIAQNVTRQRRVRSYVARGPSEMAF
ncbi:hypothetical protein YC2023_043403 [Brassica napus]